MAKLEKRKRRIVMAIILLGCAGWFALGWFLMGLCRDLGTFLMALSWSVAGLTLTTYDDQRAWRWLV